MKRIITALTVLFFVACQSPTAPEMPAEPSSAPVGMASAPLMQPAEDPHVWLGDYAGTWVTQEGEFPVSLQVIDVREDLSPIRITGLATLSGITFRIQGNLGAKKRYPDRWTWENIIETGGCDVGDMNGYFDRSGDLVLIGHSQLRKSGSCMSGMSPIVSGAKGGKGGGGGKGRISGPCNLTRDSA